MKLHQTTRLFRCYLGEIFFVVLLLSTSISAKHNAQHFNENCKKDLCAPRVSFCFVQERCHCDPVEDDCACCDDCKICLEELWDYCCGCIGFCEKSNFTTMGQSMTSTVGYLEDPDPALFKTLTDKPVPQLKYSIFKFPVIEEIAFHHHQKATMDFQHPLVVDQINGQELTKKEYWTSIHESLSNMVDFGSNLQICTVCYSDPCLSMEDCKMYCTSMGSNAFRWFHTGCCECVGSSCLNYGNQFPKCKECLQ